MKKLVETRLDGYLSPEQIVGQLKRLNGNIISVETIYKHIWADQKRGGKLHANLRNKGRRYRKRGASKDNRGEIKNQISIDKRPAIVNKKSRFGDLEIDTIIGRLP